jgi:hypothetical protein
MVDAEENMSLVDHWEEVFWSDGQTCAQINEQVWRACTHACVHVLAGTLVQTICSHPYCVSLLGYSETIQSNQRDV